MKRMIDNKDYENLKNDVKGIEGHTSAFIINQVVYDEESQKVEGFVIKDVDENITYNVELSGGGKQYQHFISVSLYDSSESKTLMEFAFKINSSSNEEINTFAKFTSLVLDILGNNSTRTIQNGAIGINGYFDNNAQKQATYLLTGNYASAYTNDTIWLVYANNTTISYANFPDPVAYTRWHYTIKDVVKEL